MLLRTRSTFVYIALASLLAAAAPAAEPGLVAHWKLSGDAQDHSGAGHHATNHNINLQTGEFNGRNGFLRVPDSSSLNFGTADFSIALQISTQDQLEDVIGDLVSKFDPVTRKGFVLTVKSNTSAYNGPSNTRPLCFATDSGTTGQWADCGRPGGKSNCSDALTVFNGDLYVGIVDAPEEKDWAHVYRYKGGQDWEDCGRVGDGHVRGVYAMIVHEGELYAATAGSHGGPNVNTGDYVRVYRYLGGTKWEDLGQPGENYRANSLASFKGELYVCSIHTGGQKGGVYVYEGNQNWKPTKDSPGRVHCLTVHDGKLYGAYPRGEVFEYEGDAWKSLGNPYVTQQECNQLHTMGVYQGELYVGTWPFGKVSIWRDGKWVDVGRMGDATEIVGLVTYNGSFYAGSIPRAEVFRYDGPHHWTSLRKLFDPATYNPKTDIEDWSRASSLTVFQDKMFVSTATCFRAMITKPLPDEIRGKVYYFKAGEGVSYDRDIGPGSKHIAAVREANTMKLYVDGQLVATQSGAKQLDVSNDVPLQIGFGPQSYFAGKMEDVRLYNRALSSDEAKSLAKAARVSLRPSKPN
jgi:hypothetical protein